jgi:hypothetical protein
MFYRAIIAMVSSLTAGVLILNVIWLAVLALPFSWLWNWTLVPLGYARVIDYGHAFGVLLLWHIFHHAGDGVEVKAEMRNPQ